jgi:hypothetical protein
MENPNLDRDRAASPRWWKDEHTSAWERVKAAFRRDWEQTKHDLSFKKKGTDLDQDVGDTIKQAAGKEPIPGHDFDRLEPAVRYGHGASMYYRDDADDWDDHTESKLREEWNDLRSGKTWDEVKDHVRRGWAWGRRKIS